MGHGAISRREADESKVESAIKMFIFVTQIEIVRFIGG